jgi:ABC-type uncharacterized transport system ATPase subunit
MSLGASMKVEIYKAYTTLKIIFFCVIRRGFILQTASAKKNIMLLITHLFEDTQEITTKIIVIHLK